MTAIEIEKDKVKAGEREILELKGRLQKMTIFFWAATALFTISVLVGAYLAYLVSQK